MSEITVAPDGMADGVLYYDEDGALQEQKAEIVVLACNGIGTPRLLLNSKSAAHPDGLANSSGLVGKNLMFHPYAVITRRLRRAAQRPPRSRWLLALEPRVLQAPTPPAASCAGYSFEAIARLRPAHRRRSGAWPRACVPWGETHHEAYAALYDHTAALVAITEDLPEETNTVTLDPDLTDGNGIPAPKITYKLSDNSRKMLAHAVERAKEALTAAGATRTVADAADAGGRLAPAWAPPAWARDPQALRRQRVGPRARRARTSSSSTAASS